MKANKNILVSIVIPVRNGGFWLEQTLKSVLSQDYEPKKHLEVSIYDDKSTDNTLAIVDEFRNHFRTAGISLLLKSATSKSDKGGVGYAKNCAVRQSSGDYICFLDADDVMAHQRVRLQLETAISLPKLTLIGSKFHREPPEATQRYTNWANSLSNSQLLHQRFTTHGPTLIAPTWFCSRELFNVVGGFDEDHEKGFPEDLDFFYRLLRMGGQLFRIEEDLITYRFHTTCASFSVARETIELMRTAEFQACVLSKWPSFSIWNAGKEGRRFFKSLDLETQWKVASFIDVDEKKLRVGSYQIWDDKTRQYVGPKIPIVSVKTAKPPAAICVKLDMTNGELEKTISDLLWVEGTDFFYLN